MADAASPSALLDLFGKVDVRLDVYLAGTDITIAELQNMETDTVLPLDSALNADVELRVGGATIGVGELVTVGDHFGVRVIRLGPTAAD